MVVVIVATYRRVVTVIANSKVGLLDPRTPGHENESDIIWCKFVCGFPNHNVFSQEYCSWRTCMKRKIDLNRILSWQDSTDAQ